MESEQIKIDGHFDLDADHVTEKIGKEKKGHNYKK